MTIAIKMNMTFFCGMDLGNVCKIYHWGSTCRLNGVELALIYVCGSVRAIWRYSEHVEYVFMLRRCRMRKQGKGMGDCTTGEIFLTMCIGFRRGSSRREWKGNCHHNLTWT